MPRTTRSMGPVAWLDVERAVESFEQAHANLGHVDIAEFCPPPGDPLRLPIAAELVRVDLEFSARDQYPRRLDDYREVFPDLFEESWLLAEVAFEEYRLRRQSGELITPEEYRSRYGIDLSSWPDGTTSDLFPRPGRGPSTAGKTDVSATSLRHAVAFPNPGDEVVGFRLVRLLGQGAFGCVYLAEQADLAGRFVALKLSTHLIGEADTLARLQHTNIVPIYSVHRTAQFQVICMPYLGPVTLADVLRKFRERSSIPTRASDLVQVVTDAGRPRLTTSRQSFSFNQPLQEIGRKSYVEACLWIAAQLADGLAHAHDRGIIHQDLKPANVLISDEGRPMLLDFNLAGDRTRDGSKPGFYGGTLSHMAPEQLAALIGEPTTVDTRCDLYALGLVLYELLTGRLATPPPRGGTRQELQWLREERSCPPTAARHLNPAVSPAVDAILARALAPDPADRYPDAHSLHEDLTRQIQHLPLKHIREPSLRERAHKVLRRHPWARSLPFVTALFALVVAIGLGGFVYRGRQLERAKADTALASFQQHVEQARPRLLLPDPDDEDLNEGLSLGRKALEAYGLPDLDRWARDTAFRQRSSEERDILRVELGELAFLMAEAEHRRVHHHESRAEAQPFLESALQLNHAAQALLSDKSTHVAYVTLQRARLLDSKGQAEKARSLRETVAPVIESNVGLWLRIADLDRRRMFRQALDLLIASEPERSGSIGYWRTRAEHHAAVNAWTEAIAALTTALALSPRDDAGLLGRRGAARLALKHYEAARADYDAALRIDPNNPALIRDRGQARLGLGDITGAIADLDRAEALEPSHTRVSFMRSRILAQAGDREAADRSRSQGLSQMPGDEMSWIARGLARIGQHPREAVEDFDQALKLNPESREALQNKASVLSEHLGRTEEAIAVLDKLIAIHPEYVPARAGRGVLLARLGRRDAAQADARSALALSEEPFTRYQVAGIYALTSPAYPEDRQTALRLLASALRDKEGLDLLASDPDLEPIRRDPELARLVAAAQVLRTAASPGPAE